MCNSLKNKRKIFEKEFHDTLIKKSQLRFKHIYDEKLLTVVTKKAIQKMGDIGGKELLFYGCGVNTNPILEFTSKGTKVTAIDISGESVKRVDRMIKKLDLQNKVKCIQMDCENMRFKNSTFDLIYGRAILHHLNMEKASKEIARVLKKSGRAVFIEPLGMNPLINLFRKLTPNQRTPFEKPFHFQDIYQIGRNFKSLKHEEWYFTVLLLILFKSIFRSRKIFQHMFNGLIATDRFLLDCFPFFKRLCWTTIITLEK